MQEHSEWDLLSAYLDGELSAPERSAVDSHLDACSSCRAEMESLTRTKAWTASAPRRAMPPDLLAALDRRFSRHTWHDYLRAWRRPVIWLPLGAAATAALTLGLWFGLGGEEELPLEPLLAAHSRYAAESLVPGDLVASNFSAQLATYHGAE